MLANQSANVRHQRLLKKRHGDSRRIGGSFLGASSMVRKLLGTALLWPFRTIWRVLLLLAVLVCTSMAIHVLHHSLSTPPLFCVSRTRILPMWIPRPPLRDEQPNFVIVDVPHNILVVFAVADSGIIGGFWWPVDRRNEGVYFRARVGRDRHETPGTVFFVPKQPDSFFVFEPDGTSIRLPLEPGQAE